MQDLGEEDALGGHELDELGRRGGLLGEEAALFVLHSEGQGVLTHLDLCRGGRQSVAEARKASREEWRASPRIFSQHPGPCRRPCLIFMSIDQNG